MLGLRSLSPPPSRPRPRSTSTAVDAATATGVPLLTFPLDRFTAQALFEVRVGQKVCPVLTTGRRAVLPIPNQRTIQVVFNDRRFGVTAGKVKASFKMEDGTTVEGFGELCYVPLDNDVHCLCWISSDADPAPVLPLTTSDLVWAEVVAKNPRS